MEKATVIVNVSQPTIQALKETTITSNRTVTITPDNGYDALAVVRATVNVPIYNSRNALNFEPYQIDLNNMRMMSYLYYILDENNIDSSSYTAINKNVPININMYNYLLNSNIQLTNNGIYNISDYTTSSNYFGISNNGTITVNVQPNLDTLNVSQLNTYIPVSPYVGYSSVTFAPRNSTEIMSQFNTNYISSSSLSSLTTSGNTYSYTKIRLNGDYVDKYIENNIQLKQYNYNNNGTYYPDVDSLNNYIFPGKIVVNVPTNNETWTNKRLTSNQTYTISNLMNDSTLDGISKTSTIVVDVPTYDITQISNYPIASNGTHTIPIPTGYDAVDSISVSVNVNNVQEIDRIQIFPPNSYYVLLNNMTLIYGGNQVENNTSDDRYYLFVWKNSSLYNIAIYKIKSGVFMVISAPANSKFWYSEIGTNGISKFVLKYGSTTYLTYNSPDITYIENPDYITMTGNMDIRTSIINMDNYLPTQ